MTDPKQVLREQSVMKIVCNPAALLITGLVVVGVIMGIVDLIKLLS